jgi:2',3'-cyclic-nucleotide 2'-phosphodiesterase (5'-nucleotidase family)
MSGIILTRRRFLAGSGAWLGSASTGFAADPAKTRTISIFHTTDLHGHIVPTQTYEGVGDVGGLARCATLIRRWKRENPDSLLLDIGDVYQGTNESLINQGNLMIGLFNRLGYDAWTLGNHDFDWGPESLEKNLALSAMPVLTGNLKVSGKSPGTLDGAWSKVRPWMMKEIGGFRIALIGLITPGLPYWLARETLGNAVVESPAEVLQRSIAEAKSAKADAIVVMGHMGWRREDDFANPVREILKASPDVDVFLAGHTHQDQPSWKTGTVLCTQASYYGIHCGRVDLTFDADTRKLIDRKAVTVLMDRQFELDPAVMEAADPDLKKSAEQLARKVATVTQPVRGTGANPPLVRLFCEIFASALKRRNIQVDGVYHGSFGTGDLAAGELTVADCWKLLPYENLLATARLTTADLIEILKEERGLRKSDRMLWPFELKLDRGGGVVSFTRDGKPVDPAATFTIALNSYDAQSGGQSMMRLREIVLRPEAKLTQTGVETRAALIDGLLERGSIP